jgi:NADH:ubiquinone oxidoreductase subunit F (NADH-binding)
VLKADECDLAMDFDTLAAAKSMLGSGGVVIMDEDTCMVKARCASCVSTRTRAAAGAFRAAKARPGCASC